MGLVEIFEQKHCQEKKKKKKLKPKTQSSLMQDIWLPYPKVVSASEKYKMQPTDGQVNSAIWSLSLEFPVFVFQL